MGVLFRVEGGADGLCKTARETGSNPKLPPRDVEERRKNPDMLQRHERKKPR